MNLLTFLNRTPLTFVQLIKWLWLYLMILSIHLGSWTKTGVCLVLKWNCMVLSKLWAYWFEATRCCRPTICGFLAFSAASWNYQKEDTLEPTRNQPKVLKGSEVIEWISKNDLARALDSRKTAARPHVADPASTFSDPSPFVIKWTWFFLSISSLSYLGPDKLSYE